MSNLEMRSFRTYWDSALRCVVLDWQCPPEGEVLHAGLEAASREMSHHGSGRLLADTGLLQSIARARRQRITLPAGANWPVRSEYLDAIGR